MVRSLATLFLAGLVPLAGLGLGCQLLRRLGFSGLNRSQTLALATSLGMALITLALAFLGLVGLLWPAVAWGVLLLGLILAVPAGRRLATNWHWSRKWQERLGWSQWLALAVGAGYGLVYLVTALSPTLEGDSTGVYLLAARAYAQHHRLVLVDYAWHAPQLPQNGLLLAAFGYLLGGQLVAQVLMSIVPGLILLGLMYAFGRTYLSAQAALFGGVVFYGMYSVAYLHTAVKIDLWWAVFDLAAIAAFAHWFYGEPDEREWRWLVLVGVFLGVAGGTKQASVFTAIVLSAAVAVRLWQDGQRRPGTWVRAYLALGLPTALAVLWVVRTYLMTGALGFTGAELRGDSGLVGFFRTLWQMSMLGNAPSVEGPLGKSIGPTILAIVPLLALFRNVERRVWHIMAFCGLMLVLWFNGVQRARHLLPTLALLSLLTGYVVTLLLAHRPRLGQLTMVLIVVSMGLNLGIWGYINLVSLQRLPYVLGLQGLDGYLTANLPKVLWYPNYAMIAYTRDHLPTDARIAALSSGNSYYLERPFYTNWSQTPAEIPAPDEFADQLRAAGITHVFANDYVINIRGLQDAWLLQPEFQARYLTELICADDQCLYAVSDTANGTAAKD